MLYPATTFFLRSLIAQASVMVVSSILLIFSTCTRAETLGSYYHTPFDKQDGAPTDIGGLTQTSDGFLWIAGSKGLTVYDGKTFKAFRPLPGENFPEAQLDELFPAEGGGLWIAHDTTGVALLKNGHLSNFGPAQGYEGGKGRFIKDKQGHVWSYNTIALMRFENGVWKTIYRSSPGQDVIAHASFDDDGNLWAIIEHRLLVMPAGESKFKAVPGTPEGAWRVFAGASGHLYVVVNKTELHIYRRRGLDLAEEAKPMPVPIFCVLEGRNGSVWLGSTLQGLYYISAEDLAAAESSHAPPRFQSLTQSDGLTNNYAAHLLEDSEGDVWLGTSTGLDRFRPVAFTRIDLPRGIHTVSASVDGQGNLWVGSETHPVLFGPPSGQLKETELPRLTLASYVDPRDKSVWTTNVNGVWELDSGGVPKLRKPLTSKEVGLIGAFPCMLRDNRGAFYVCIPTTGRGNGLLVSDGESWKEVFDHPVFPVALGTDSKGNIWAGSRQANRLYMLNNGTQILFTEKQGLAVGVVRAIQAGRDTLWVGGDEGIQYFDGRRFVTLPSDRDEVMKPVAGLVEDRHGDIWAQTLDGVLRIRAAEIRGFHHRTQARVHLDLFDEADGVPGNMDLSWTNPTVRMGLDGKIWAQTGTGLAWIDPDHIRQQSHRPSVYVDSLDTQDRSYSVIGSDIQLPPGQKALRIGYSSPSLSRPDKISFRYRLMGMTENWQEAGDRREAIFTNLPPGKYRFEVMASSGNEASSPVASIGFERLPAYYETAWFRALFAVPIALMLWIALDMRARVLARRLKIRSDERESIARDIHDTLLQRLHAVMISLKRLSSDVAIPMSSRKVIAQVHDETRDAIIEGRGQILALRRGQDVGLALYDQLMAEGRRLQAGGSAHFALDVRGTPRPLNGAAEIELRGIALEAMRNAFAHSSASKVVVTFNYEEAAFWLVVSDDGTGFCQQKAGTAQRDGHFGLVGMKERAVRLKGSINIESSPEEGTEVHIRVPARVIYAGKKTWHAGSDPLDGEKSIFK